MILKRQKVYLAYLPRGRKYIGHTHNIKKRMWEHFNHKGSKITRKYKPYLIKVVGTCFPESNCHLQEKRLFKKLSKKYGYSKVRGWRYTNSKNF